MKAITPRQRQILDFIKETYEAKGFAPSIVEIAEHIGVKAKSTVHQHLKYMVQKGLLIKESRYSKRGYILPEGEHA